MLIFCKREESLLSQDKSLPYIMVILYSPSKWSKKAEWHSDESLFSLV